MKNLEIKEMLRKKNWGKLLKFFLDLRHKKVVKILQNKDWTFFKGEVDLTDTLAIERIFGIIKIYNVTWGILFFFEHVSGCFPFFSFLSIWKLFLIPLSFFYRRMGGVINNVFWLSSIRRCEAYGMMIYFIFLRNETLSLKKTWKKI